MSSKLSFSKLGVKLCISAFLEQPETQRMLEMEAMLAGKSEHEIDIDTLKSSINQTENDLNPNDQNMDSQHSLTIMKRLKKWQFITCFALFTAYTFSFFVEDEIYLIEDDFKQYLSNNGKNGDLYFGLMVSLGYIFYMIGKLLWSFLTDTYIKSGVFPFAISLLIGPILSGLLAIIIIPNDNKTTLRVTVCILLWGLHRMCQSAAYLGLVRIVSNWIEYKYHGRIMSIVALGAFVGDASVRGIIGFILKYYTDSWKFIVIFCSLMSMSVAFPMFCLLKDSPKSRDLPMPKENEETNVYKQSCTNSETGTDSVNMRLKDVFIPVLQNPFYYILLALSFEYSVILALFGVYLASFLSSSDDITTSSASFISAIFPLMGIVSTPFSGWWVDRYLRLKKPHLRLSIIPITSLFNTVCLAIITYYSFSKVNISSYLMISLVMILGMNLWGPYALLSGVLSIDLGGHTSSAMICGTVDAFGSLGGFTISLISGFYGFDVMFAVATIMSIIMVITGCVLFLYNKRKYHKMIKSQYDKFCDQNEK